MFTVLTCSGTVHVDPKVQVCPFTVVAEFANPALVKVPVNPSFTFPADGLLNVRVNPFVAELFWKLIVLALVRATALT